LEQHSNDVRNMAGLFAERAGLPAEVAADVALAAWLHDAGKADPRFQTWLYGGSWLDVGVEVLAKSIGLLPNGSWDRAGLPPSWRHEALSVRIAREHPRFVTACDPELVLWLVGVHHGFGRPFFPDAAEAGAFEAPDVLEGLRAGVEPGPQSLAFEFGGFDWPQMFQRLKARYGVWELARLEAILRLADHRASEMRGGGV
jgi:CRISPR-associated endonuclease/helicase Cas3